jgi:hypothetical protein
MPYAGIVAAATEAIFSAMAMVAGTMERVLRLLW